MEEICQVWPEESSKEERQKIETMSEEQSLDENTQAAIELLESGRDPKDEPTTWHGGLSYATLLLLPFGISAEQFVGARPGVRDLALDHLDTVEKQRALRSLTLCLIVALGFVLLLDSKWRLVACGGVALKAGVDLGRFAARRRTLKRARSIQAGDLDLTKPEENLG